MTDQKRDDEMRPIEDKDQPRGDQGQQGQPIDQGSTYGQGTGQPMGQVWKTGDEDDLDETEKSRDEQSTGTPR